MKSNKKSIALRNYWKKVKGISLSRNVTIKEARIIYRSKEPMREVKVLREDKIARVVNFNLKANKSQQIPVQSRDKFKGYFITNKKLSFSDMIYIIKSNLPKNYYPYDFVYAEEYRKLRYSEIVVLREEVEIYRNIVYI